MIRELNYIQKDLLESVRIARLEFDERVRKSVRKSLKKLYKKEKKRQLSKGVLE